MEFEYKTEAQLKEMSQEQRDKYAVDKRKFEADQQEKAIADAVKKAKEELTKEFESKASKAEDSDELTTLKADFEEQKKIIKKQGEQLAIQAERSGKMTGKTIEAIFKEKYDEAVSGENKRVNEQISIDVSKASASTDIMSVEDVDAATFPLAGSSPVVSSGLRSIYGQIVGFFRTKRTKSRIMELVDVIPLTEGTLIAVNETIVGEAEITPECTLKPVVRVTMDIQEATADPVAVQWHTTTKLRRFFSSIANRFRKTFVELVDEKIPSYVLDYIAANGSAFTPVGDLAISDDPNNYDALGAVIATLENLGYMPDGIIMNPIDWRNMKQQKTADGVYTLSNGQSVAILQNELDWGGVNIPIIKDPAMEIGTFTVGAFNEVVKAGVDSMLIYMETDGRTDVLEGARTNSITGLSRNIRTHVLEKFIAVIIPSSISSGIVTDTFANVKTLITPETP